MKKIIMVNDKCDNCGDCVKACMEVHEVSRIGILEHKGRYLPVVCQHCASAPCKEVCPVEAIENKDGVIYLDESKCIGCGLCAMACPFGAITMTEVAHKCSLCIESEGDCACVKACSKRCLDVVGISDIIFDKRDKNLENIYKLYGSSDKKASGTLLSKITSSAKVGNPLK
ncbi:4Fe-4S dicluster domain-containing protein [Methanothermococcus okinawensis]|uniref:4Fe-4S ferredoxin iron-sulfur binding domain-containing protein n=1 Tax=Methanothermococcus okinawensis (strain DSM 14208 / JCM 11175 / IH1) TaxID=647113 RepID=F8AMS8_METOI|nr:4Fe-4S dicluster domain-containing protein [Methanothermococcus okinawensis]AEH06909.1 4Fe-4S ferredoxin iron-sulfur binding domain-containing protein [Methanothermococcus okinawensis IH1]